MSKYKKPKILIIISHYLPGFKSGGPVRSINNMVDQLKDEFEFLIITLDRDLNDIIPYSGIIPNQWQPMGNAEVFYITPSNLNFRYIVKILTKTTYDILYLNSFFDFNSVRVLIAHKFWFIPKKPIILAPRGELVEGCLRLKYIKKKVFIKTVKLLGIHKGITWQASSEYELYQINKIMNVKRDLIHIALNIPTELNFKESEDIGIITSQSSDDLKIIFLSRISKEKNLDYALKVLMQVKVNVIFDIYGIKEDPNYWRECEKLIKQLPSNIKVNYLGRTNHDKVVAIFKQYDLFFFPTKGENYGHVIVESLTSGTPVLISKTTPWRNLENNCLGWDFDLESHKPFVNVIEHLASLNLEERYRIRAQVKANIFEQLNYNKTIEDNIKLFRNQLVIK
jgi:glycosyltransferase involved in cell wall biosynthesis